MKAVLNVVAAVLIAAGLVVAVASFMAPGQVILGIDVRLAATLVIGGFILLGLARALVLLERMNGELRRLRKAEANPPWLREAGAAMAPAAQAVAAQASAPAEAPAPAAPEPQPDTRPLETAVPAPEPDLQPTPEPALQPEPEAAQAMEPAEAEAAEVAAAPGGPEPTEPQLSEEPTEPQPAGEPTEEQPAEELAEPQPMQEQPAEEPAPPRPEEEAVEPRPIEEPVAEHAQHAEEAPAAEPAEARRDKEELTAPAAAALTAAADAPQPHDETAAEELAELYVVEERLFRGKQARVLSDGTIEAETAEGWMRFEDFDHLDEYLDATTLPRP